MLVTTNQDTICGYSFIFSENPHINRLELLISNPMQETYLITHFLQESRLKQGDKA